MKPAKIAYEWVCGSSVAAAAAAARRGFHASVRNSVDKQPDWAAKCRQKAGRQHRGVSQQLPQITAGLNGANWISILTLLLSAE